MGYSDRNMDDLGPGEESDILSEIRELWKLAAALRTCPGFEEWSREAAGTAIRAWNALQFISGDTAASADRCYLESDRVHRAEPGAIGLTGPRGWNC